MRVLAVVLVVLLSAVLGFVAGVAVGDRVTLPGTGWRDARDTGPPDARATALVALLEDIVASESVMLAFGDAIGAGLTAAPGEAEALAAIADAAAAGAAGLRDARPALVVRTGDPAVDDVRDAYLPHLDAWIDYLAALTDRPAILLSGPEQQPYLLLINSTAAVFADALEALLASGPGPEVSALAERILDDGFRGAERDPDV